MRPGLLSLWPSRRALLQDRESRASYYGLISECDDNLGRVFEAIEASGQRENTVVILTTDQSVRLCCLCCFLILLLGGCSRLHRVLCGCSHPPLPQILLMPPIKPWLTGYIGPRLV